MQKHHATTPGDILSQPIWHNDFIKIGNTTFFYKTWCENGIFFIKDIINNDGNLFSLEQLNGVPVNWKTEKTEKNEQKWKEIKTKRKQWEKKRKETKKKNETQKKKNENKIVRKETKQKKKKRKEKKT